MNTLFETINQALTLYLVFPFIVFLGLYFTISLKGFQLSKLFLSFKNLLQKKKEASGDISHFEAVSTVLAGNFGTGNISGMAMALTTGGPGALVWMWIVCFFGMAVQYASCVLGVKYREQDRDGQYVAGPMYYLSSGLKSKVLAYLFCIFTLLAAITVGNFAQINSMTLPMQAISLDPLYTSFVLAALIGLVLIGGISRIAKVASIIVPIKAFLYVIFAVIILYFNSHAILPAFKTMFTSAFDFQSAAGGILGASVLKAMTTGFNRGIFATDAGTGIVPILQGSARTDNPVIDGLVTLVAPFMVMIVCTLTGLVLITTGAYEQGLKSTNMVTEAFSIGLGNKIGEYVVIIALMLFGFTTILAWSYCAKRAVSFLVGSKWGEKFDYFYIALIPIGAILQVDLIWTLADLCITGMLLINLFAISALAKEVVTDSKAYFKTI